MDAPSAAGSAERNEPRGGEGGGAEGSGSAPRGAGGRAQPPREPARQPVSGRGGLASGRARRAPQRPLRGGGGSWFRLRAQRWWRRRDRPGCNRRPSGSGWSGSGGRVRREATPQGSGGSGASGGSRRRSGGRSSSKTDSWTRAAAAAGPGRVSRAEAGGESSPPPPPLPPPPPPPR
ncbi:protein tyrosine phosphatase type IVA 2 isoform X1 [Callorhinus ursinus]|uniref:protein tyrosine phosphatase type IVA 2 isoform X1 n=1 Tax=Callorhinus ursinus TaxID=34884 RepID=UPI000F7FCEA9